MTELLTAAQMRAFEQAVIASGVVSGRELMDRAGRGVVDAIFSRWPTLAATQGRAVIYCGPGNNGGDGYVIARLLHDWGWQVAVHTLGMPERLPPDALENCRLWRARGQVSDLFAEPSDGRSEIWQETPDLFVDALFGTGLARPLDAATEQALATVTSIEGLRRVAVDIPSGLCSDSGRAMGNRSRYDLTVTFHGPKPGHYLSEGPDICGALEVVDIGLPPQGLGARLPEKVARRVEAPTGLDKRAGHKYDHGHAMVLSGPMGRSGAARMAARAALRVGAGLVTVAAPGAAMLECAAHLTAIMLRKCDGASELAGLLSDGRLSALCLGPGLGVGQDTADLVAAALAPAPEGSARGVVLDADALTAFQDGPARLFALTARAPATVLTPHDGEFRRLFPDLAERLQGAPDRGPAYGRLDAARAAAARAGCVVVLKGPDTVIAAPTGQAAIHAAAYGRAAPWLATAGAGDVLAGLITGLLARGWGPMAAAEAAAWLHVEAARQVGPGLIAEDLAEALPTVFRALGA
ncbi:bifunctional ADP-dependent NAD(P)H-hydrate dehydratase/NAD(P)H-hydrate epimerase [Nioella nitratireducens]|uniref:bifunctional ADP-dependent NAD(P)H-hydrate dehydratase/NAD(P)H-hydrate epimerase n=1 Tax=Nioella nitratireducens TaxID=1287720 RepID=UPI0008FD9125|nr:bifunctional ADP-dependent NAD(P)H-hydrate dehydratase/NAD(P)H-hydrate epimerase [Nioella nitratireducens]